MQGRLAKKQRYIIRTESENYLSFLKKFKVFADVAELADAHGSGPCAARLKGSTPFVGTIFAGMA